LILKLHMKRTLLLSALFFSIFYSKAQVVFSEDFDGISGPTAGGAGTYNFPNGWLLFNVDNRTPAVQVAYVNEAWERREDFGLNVSDSVAFSTSYYSPFGPADDWMWTPLINLPSNTKLKWSARAYDAGYTDGYQVRIMTQSSTPGGPIGGPSSIGNQVTNSTILFNTPAENVTWTDREVDLASYAGESVWIAFRNNSNDKFLLVIDDIIVEQNISYNAGISNFASSEYSQIPLSQVLNTPTPFTSTISNYGLMQLTGVTMNVSVTDASNAIVYSASSPTQSLAPGANANFSVNGFSPTYASTYTVKAYSTCNEGDQLNANDTLSWNIQISDSVYSRDNGNIVGGLGIGAGVGGYLGQAFSISEADTLTSISMGLVQGYLGEEYAAVIWNTQNGVPSTIVGATDTLIYSSISSQFNTLPIDGLLVLQPGEYVVTAIEFDSTIQLSVTDQIFTPGKIWVNWATLGTWSNVESFGSSFAKPFVLRPNFGTLCNTVNYQQVFTICEGDSLSVGSSVYTQSGIYFDTLPNGFCDSIVETQLTVIPSVSPQVFYQPLSQLTTPFVIGATYQWIDCNLNQPIAGQNDTIFIAPMDGVYAVQVSNSGCIDTSECIEVIFSGLVGLQPNTFSISPNPVIDEVFIKSNQSGVFELINPFGQLVLEHEIIAEEPIMLSLGEMASGVYFLKLKGTSIVEKIILK
jgi:hypothetical protein